MFPLISEYIEAIKSAEDSFKELTYLRPLFDDDGQPVMTSGNFAVVFKMQDVETGKYYALKCFTKEQEGRGEAYHLIAEELKDVDSSYLINIRYLDKELFVDTTQTDETEFPVLLMDWVEGKTLDKYLRENLDDKYALEMLAYRFSQLAQWLIPQPFAHGDLKPDNILVREDGTIVLVDYDGMYVPAMKGQKARELGSPDFRHPLRTENDFNEHIDHFPIISILFSLKAISHKPFLLDKYGAGDRLLFSKNDYCDISKSKLIKEICPSEDKELNNLIGLFLISDYINNADEEGNYEIRHTLIDIGVSKSCNYFNSRLIHFISVGNFTDETSGSSEEEYRKAWTDEYGVKYNNERKELLRGTDSIFYVVKDGTIAIDSWAFYRKWKLKSIELPSSLKYIRFRAFSECTSLEAIQLPNSIKRIGDLAFMDCRSLNSITLPKSLSRIGEGTFRGCRSLKKVFIPNSVTSIGKKAFCGCSAIKEIFIPKSVVSIGYHAFVGCRSLKTVYLSNFIEKISMSTFAGCSDELKIVIPKRVWKQYEERLLDMDTFPEDKEVLLVVDDVDVLDSYVSDIDLTFARIDDFGVSYSHDEKRLLRASKDIDNYNIKDGTITICEGAFNFNKMHSIHFPDSVMNIGSNALLGCNSLEEVIIPKSVVKIGESIIWNCNKLVKIVVEKENIFYDSRENCNAIIETRLNKLIVGCKNTVIPSSVFVIGESAFNSCSGLKNIIIPNSVVTIEEYAFAYCIGLTSVEIPNSVISICDSAFAGCENLMHVIIPNSVNELGEGVFDACVNLEKVTIPEPVTKILKYTFSNCKNLKEIILSNSIRYIGDFAFGGCTSLTDINLSDSIEFLSNCAFRGCNNLSKISVPRGTKRKFERFLPDMKDIICEILDDCPF